jgi:hypothetical protein
MFPWRLNNEKLRDFFGRRDRRQYELEFCWRTHIWPDRAINERGGNSGVMGFLAAHFISVQEENTAYLTDPKNADNTQRACAN